MTTQPAINQAQVLRDMLAHNLDNSALSGAVRTRLRFTRALVEATFAAVQQNKSSLLTNAIDEMLKFADSDAVVAYMMASMMAMTRALLMQVGELPGPESGEPPHDN